MGAICATTAFPAPGPAGSPSPAAEQSCNEMGFSLKNLGFGKFGEGWEQK